MADRRRARAAAGCRPSARGSRPPGPASYGEDDGVGRRRSARCRRRARACRRRRSPRRARSSARTPSQSREQRARSPARVEARDCAPARRESSHSSVTSSSPCAVRPRCRRLRARRGSPPSGRSRLDARQARDRARSPRRRSASRCQLSYFAHALKPQFDAATTSPAPSMHAGRRRVAQPHAVGRHDVQPHAVAAHAVRLERRARRSRTSSAWQRISTGSCAASDARDLGVDPRDRRRACPASPARGAASDPGGAVRLPLGRHPAALGACAAPVTRRDSG